MTNIGGREGGMDKALGMGGSDAEWAMPSWNGGHTRQESDC